MDSNTRREQREERLRSLGFDELTKEQRREQLARNVASMDWPTLCEEKRARRDSVLERKHEIRQLARDLLLTVVRRGDQAVDPAAIYDVARRFVEAGEAE